MTYQEQITFLTCKYFETISYIQINLYLDYSSTVQNNNLFLMKQIYCPRHIKYILDLSL